VMVPRNEIELQRAMVTAKDHPGPFAYRYPRGPVDGVTLPGPPEPVAIGRGEKLEEGNDGVIFAVGITVRPALLAADQLEKEGIRLAVVDPRFVKPLDRELLCAEAARTGVVITVEENVLPGGFGSAVLELMEEEGLSPKLLRIGLPDTFIEQGSQKELRSLYGIDADGIARRIWEFFSRMELVPASSMELRRKRSKGFSALSSLLRSV